MTFFFFSHRRYIADWILFMTCFWKSLDVADLDEVSSSSSILSPTSTNPGASHTMDLVSSSESGNLTWNAEIKEILSMRLVNLQYFMIPSFLVSYLFFFGIGGFLHVSTYYSAGSLARDWRWITWRLSHSITTRNMLTLGTPRLIKEGSKLIEPEIWSCSGLKDPFPLEEAHRVSVWERARESEPKTFFLPSPLGLCVWKGPEEMRFPIQKYIVQWVVYTHTSTHTYHIQSYLGEEVRPGNKFFSVFQSQAKSHEQDTKTTNLTHNVFTSRWWPSWFLLSWPRQLLLYVG